nr:MAG TPA: hypothetical protein [Caudoviricetes sp.]
MAGVGAGVGQAGHGGVWGGGAAGQVERGR